MEIDWYNDFWGSRGSNFLPMTIQGTQGNLQNELTYARISSSYFEHPALSMFNDPSNGSLAEALIKKWIVMDESKVRNDPLVTILEAVQWTANPSRKNLGKEWSCSGALH